MNEKGSKTVEEGEEEELNANEELRMENLASRRQS